MPISWSNHCFESCGGWRGAVVAVSPPQRQNSAAHVCGCQLVYGSPYNCLRTKRRRTESGFEDVIDSPGKPREPVELKFKLTSSELLRVYESAVSFNCNSRLN